MAELDLDRLAAQARLRLDAAEKPAVEADLEAMLEFAGRLAAVDTGGVPPTLHPLPVEGALRPDAVTPPLPREALLAGAPSAEDGFIRVPRMVE